MTASRFVLVATTTTALLSGLTGCIGPTSPVAAVSHRGTSDVFPWSDPDLAPGTIQGELRRGPPLPADEGLDTTRPWAGVNVDILDETGQKSAETVSDSQGMFRVDVAPGNYSVRPHWPLTQLHPAINAPRAAGVTVVSGATVSVRLAYDPGVF